VWVLDPKNQWLQLRGETDNTCIDLDMTDRNLEMYSCNQAVISHQQFAYDKATGSFTVLVDKSCMTVVVDNSTVSESIAQDLELRAVDGQIAAAEAQLDALLARRQWLAER
jgi:hypothetical protein